MLERWLVLIGLTILAHNLSLLARPRLMPKNRLITLQRRPTGQVTVPRVRYSRLTAQRIFAQNSIRHTRGLPPQMLQNTIFTVTTNSILDRWDNHQALTVNQRPQVTWVYQSHLVWNFKCQGRQRSKVFVAATSAVSSPLTQSKNESLFCSQVAHIDQPRRHSRREIKTHVQENTS